MATESNLVIAADHNFKLYKGDTFSAVLTFTDGSGSAINLSAATLVMQVKSKATDSTSELELTEGDGLTVSGGSSNIVTISSNHDLAAGRYVYDFQATTGSTVVTYLKGFITVYQDVTR
jgi:hypothetical protein